MTTARLMVNARSLSLRTSRAATGDVTLVLGAKVFPVAGWNDFVLVVVEAWISALVRLLRRVSVSERVHFMEGPYAVDVTRSQSGAFRLRAIERPNREHAVVDEHELPLTENAVATAEELLAECRARAYESADVDRLGVALAALCSEMRALRK